MVLAIVAIATCSVAEDVDACPLPDPDSEAGIALQQARDQVRFPVYYPCRLPGGGEKLVSASVVGQPGRQQVEMFFEGPFDMAIRQSQFPPPVSADPAGASHTEVQLFPNVTAELIERYDGSSKIEYHLVWQERGFYWEIQAEGPPQQRRDILLLARSLTSDGTSLATVTP